ncbi:MAG: efflux RND transporter periplasmic adaptor subunit, partial [Steroidobacteraceae bacterium]
VMDEKTSLLEQLRIDRGEDGAGAGSRAGREGAVRRARRWQLIAGVCLAVALGAVGFSAWSWMQGRHGATAARGAAAGSGQAAALAGASAEAGDAAGGEGAGAGDSPAAAGTAVLDASGYIVAQRQATVSAKTTGRLRDLYIQEGQPVKAGQIVARLDDSNSRAALAVARAQLAQAEAGLAGARTAFSDARPIFVRNEQERTAAVISAQDFDTAKSAFDAARTNLTTQQAGVQAARANLQVAERFEDDTIVRAPFTGVVTNKAAQPGDIVSPVSAGGGFTQTGICTIVDMGSLEAEVDVSENFINRVHPGQRAIVHLNAYPQWSIPAQVVAIVPTADRSKATVKVRVGFKTRDARILPEMGARVSFLAEGPQQHSSVRGTPQGGRS